jgi:hypothetical protein
MLLTPAVDAGTEIHLDIVNPIVVNHYEVLVSRLWVKAPLVWGMPKLNAQVELSERRFLEIYAVPFL